MTEMTTETSRAAFLRIGFGEDAHALVPGRPLVIGGVNIPDSPRGAAAHSDGDVLLHALSDALLSTRALGDIGHYFPPSDPQYKDLDSTVILREVWARVREGLEPPYLYNVAAVLTLDAPKLGRYRETIRDNVATLLGLAPDEFGLGFKTSEGLAPDHIQARVTLLLASPQTPDRTADRTAKTPER